MSLERRSSMEVEGSAGILRLLARPCTNTLAALVVLALALNFAGCTTRNHVGVSTRRFSFQTDTFAYRNELKWDYGFDTNGKWTAHRHDPKPTYWLRCFVVSRSAKQFFLAARFDPTLPRTTEADYCQLIRRVIHSSTIHELPDAKRIVIPGYANLRQFSTDHEAVLKSECGGAWRSYFQRGHWRMVFPFSRRQQEKVATQIQQQLREHSIAVVHVAVFPKLTINHAVVIFDAHPGERDIQFSVYDPNRPESPITMTFDRSARRFRFPTTNYFPGGDVNVYVVYRSAFY